MSETGPSFEKNPDVKPNRSMSDRLKDFIKKPNPEADMFQRQEFGKYINEQEALTQANQVAQSEKQQELPDNIVRLDDFRKQKQGK